jgi:methylated-DNA-[protein]-cysteine S-methyltransferase
MNDVKLAYTSIDSPIGRLLLTSDGKALCGIYMESHKRGPEPRDDWRQDAGPFRQVADELAAYFSGRLRRFEVAMALRGTEFQRRVWRELCQIEFGQTRTYGQLAARIGAPSAVRAVGAAVGRNPISIIVPCHRVVGSNGGLTGFAGGLDRKRWLLDHEGADVVSVDSRRTGALA